MTCKYNCLPLNLSYAGCKCVIAISETGNRCILYCNPLWFGVGRWEGCDDQGQRCAANEGLLSQRLITLVIAMFSSVGLSVLCRQQQLMGH